MKMIVFSVLGLICFFEAKGSCLDELTLRVKDEVLNYDEIKELVEMDLKFHCKEASLITSLSAPYLDRNKVLNDVESFFENLFKIFPGESSVEILKPYCRSEEMYFGDFCMATDIHATNTVLRDGELLDQLPDVLRYLGNRIKDLPSGKKIDLISELETYFSGQTNGKYKAIILGTYVGLDDNSVQIMRLLSNLVYLKDYDRFVKNYVTNSLAGNVQTKHYGDFKNDTGTVMYSTRTGVATIPPLISENNKKTYKVYSSVYFGCQMALNNKLHAATILEAQAAGMGYELLKLRPFLHNAEQLRKNFPVYFQNGKNVGRLMGIGADWGFQYCRQF